MCFRSSKFTVSCAVAVADKEMLTVRWQADQNVQLAGPTAVNFMDRTHINPFPMLLVVFAVSRATCVVAQDDMKCDHSDDRRCRQGFQSRVKALKDFEQAGVSRLVPQRLSPAKKLSRMQVFRLVEISNVC